MNAEDMNTLREGLSLLPVGDRGMVSLYLQRGKFNSVQERYLQDMLKLVKAGPEGNLPSYPPGEHGKLLWHFQNARKYMTFPKILMRGWFEGEDLMLSLTGKGGKEPGTVAIGNGGAFGKAKMYGIIDLNGTYQPQISSYFGAALAEDLDDLLLDMSVDLAGTATKYHIAKYHCMFTGDTMDNSKEAKFGYRRVTGLRWGLPTPDKASV